MNPNLPAPENDTFLTDPTVTIVIPARNEAKNLALVLPQLPAVHQVILVDGDSVDGTVATAKALMPDIHVVSQTRRGKGNALACGFAAATGDVIVMFDADGSADPEEIPRYIEALVAGAHVAKGSRFRKGGGSEDITRFRALGNHGLNLLTNMLLGTRYTDLCYGYNAFRRSILPHLDLPDTTLPQPRDGRMLWGDGFEIETIINCRIAFADLDVVEVPSVEKLRIHGESNLNAVSDGFRVLKTILDERSRGLAGRRLAKKAGHSSVTAGGAIAVPVRGHRDAA